VNEDFLRIIGRTDVPVGQKVDVDVETFVRAVAALRAAGDTFQIALGAKYFGVGKSVLPSVHFPVFPRTPSTIRTGEPGGMEKEPEGDSDKGGE
jgi:hypothetical protein